MEKAYLVLSDGQVFEGWRCGAAKEAVGELVFTTGMGGYLETLTDPSYFGQIVVQTFPLIGNYGVIPTDFEGRCHVGGYVCRELCGEPSNFRSEYELDQYLKEQGVAAICGIDTRQLTRVLREQGTMNAVICDKVPADLTTVQTYQVQGAVEAVSHGCGDRVPAQGESMRFRVALLDCGVRRSTVRELTRRGCEVRILPHDSAAETLLTGDFDGVLLSDGPGDPAENGALVEEVRKLMGRLPVFGVGLGHQLMALAQGGKTAKCKCGHRGGNQAVKQLTDGRVYTTVQNHGYAVEAEGLQSGTVSFINVNDGSCEGLRYPALRAFSVQFQPESCFAPGEDAFLFDQFVTLMEGGRL